VEGAEKRGKGVKGMEGGEGEGWGSVDRREGPVCGGGC